MRQSLVAEGRGSRGRGSGGSATTSVARWRRGSPALGIEEVGGAFETAIYNSGSAWADFQKFMRALLGGRLVSPGLLREMKVPTPGALNGTPPSVPLEGGNVATYGLGLEHYTWSHSCGVYGHSGSFPG